MEAAAKRRNEGRLREFAPQRGLANGLGADSFVCHSRDARGAAILAFCTNESRSRPADWRDARRIKALESNRVR
jgi:hypothetical protein